MLDVTLCARYTNVSEGMFHVTCGSMDGSGVARARVRACSVSH